MATATKPINEHGISTLMTITPRIAEDWLNNNSSNRPLSQKTIARYADEMAAGKWEVNGETICLSNGGRLLNGQHRLRACILADTGFQSWVIMGVDPTTFFTIDTGRPRSGGDVLAIRGESNSKKLSSTLTLLWKYRSSSSAWTNPTQRNRLELLDNNPNIRDSVLVGLSVEHIVNCPVGAVVHYEGKSIDPIKTDQFFEAVKTGANLEAGHPALMLRNLMITKRSNTRHEHGMNPKWMLAVTIKAFNVFIAGRKIGVLKYGGDEKFPQIGG